MSKKLKSLLPILAALLLVLAWQALKQPEAAQPVVSTPTKVQETSAPAAEDSSKSTAPDEEGLYTSARDVADYLKAYGTLPRNFITKAEARKLGWPGGDLRPYAEDTCIGGDRFGNYEGLLPSKKGRVYYECDIDTLGKSSRGAKRLVYSNDGLIYYTEDHYESFTLLYGEDDHAAN